MNMQPQEQGYHYGVMRRAIELIDAGGEGLTLDELAVQMDMSPAHFQRLFSRWVGVSPKRYQQYLTLGHAKTMMREHCTTLQTSLATGLSGSGRLHDLFLRWESMSPGEYARSGAGLVIYWGWFESPLVPLWSWALTKASAVLALRQKPELRPRWRNWFRAGQRPNLSETR